MIETLIEKSTKQHILNRYQPKKKPGHPKKNFNQDIDSKQQTFETLINIKNKQ